MHLCVCSVIQLCPTLATPWTVVYQAPLAMEFSRQDYWSRLPFPSTGGSSWPRDWTCISCIGRQILYHCTTWETPMHVHISIIISVSIYMYLYLILRCELIQIFPPLIPYHVYHSRTLCLSVIFHSNSEKSDFHHWSFCVPTFFPWVYMYISYM